MRSGPRPLELALPDEMDPAHVVEWIRRDLDVTVAPWSSTDRFQLDTFDGRLHRAGLTLWRDARRARGGAFTLTLEAPWRPAMQAAVRGSRSDRLDASDLPSGPARELVEASVDQRALLVRFRLRSRGRRIDVHNDDGKTVVRLSIDEPVVALANGGAAPLGRRLHLEPVLGYDRAFARLTRDLETKLGLAVSATTVADEAAAAAGVPIRGFSSAVDVDLDPGMRADHATTLICTRLADIVDGTLPGTLADLDVEFLHDLRVAIRRSRSVLKEMAGVLPVAAAQRARDDLRWMQAITGPTRDLDVQLEDWPRMVRGIAPMMAADLPPLHDLLARHRAAAFARMRRQLRGRRFADAWSAWRALLESAARSDAADAGPKAAVPVDELAGRRIRSVYSSMVKTGSSIDDDSAPEQLHDLRKRGKELRYLLELFGGVFPATTVKPLVSTLKDLQDVLGRFQDDQIQSTYLRELGPELAQVPGGTDSLIALGLLIDNLASDQQRAREAFADRFKPFASGKTRALVREQLDPRRRNRARA